MAGVAALWWQKIVSEDPQARMFQLSARLIGTRANIGPNSMAVAEKCLALFQNAGFHGVEADHAVTTLMAYVLGITTTETDWRETVAAAKMSVEEWLAQHKPAIEYAVRSGRRR